jgi:hypothetical protein
LLRNGIRSDAVMVPAQLRDGKPTALRALAGRDGFTPPM